MALELSFSSDIIDRSLEPVLGSTISDSKSIHADNNAQHNRVNLKESQKSKLFVSFVSSSSSTSSTSLETLVSNFRASAQNVIPQSSDAKTENVQSPSKRKCRTKGSNKISKKCSIQASGHQINRNTVRQATSIPMSDKGELYDGSSEGECAPLTPLPIWKKHPEPKPVFLSTKQPDTGVDKRSEKAITKTRYPLETRIRKDIQDLHRLMGSQTNVLKLQDKVLERSCFQNPVTTNRTGSRIDDILRRRRRHHSPPDSLEEEIQKLRSSYVGKKAAEVVTKEPEPNIPVAQANMKEESIKKSQELELPGLEEAAKLIDDTLILALQPFGKVEKGLQETSTTDAERKETSEHLQEIDLALPCVAQQIVNQLENAFSEMTKSKQQELDNEKFAAEEAKKAEEVKMMQEKEAKEIADRATLEKEMAVLSMLPLEGRLMTSINDVEDALLRLEYAESKSKSRRQQLSSINSESKLTDVVTPTDGWELEMLRRQVLRKAEAIEARMKEVELIQHHNEMIGITCPPIQFLEDGESLTTGNVTQEVVPASIPIEENLASNTVTAIDQEEIQEKCSWNGSMSKILKEHVVEKLEFTILKLKHTLEIDLKEAAEQKELEQLKAAEEEMKKAQAKQDEELKRKGQEIAEDARKRVMGLTSVDQVKSWTDESTRLEQIMSYPSSKLEHFFSDEDNPMFLSDSNEKINNPFAYSPLNDDNKSSNRPVDPTTFRPCEYNTNTPRFVLDGPYTRTYANINHDMYSRKSNSDQYNSPSITIKPTPLLHPTAPNPTFPWHLPYSKIKTNAQSPVYRPASVKESDTNINENKMDNILLQFKENRKQKSLWFRSFPSYRLQSIA